MKKLYQKPEMSIVKMIELEAVDIIRTSGEVAETPNAIKDIKGQAVNYAQLPNSDISVFN